VTGVDQPSSSAIFAIGGWKKKPGQVGNASDDLNDRSFPSLIERNLILRLAHTRPSQTRLADG
jgi:hypothetical protein